MPPIRLLPWLALPCLLAVAGCAPGRVSLPVGAGTPVPHYAAMFQQATARCRSVHTFTAALAMAGRAGGRGIRGRLLAGLERPDGLYLEAVAPFGGPVFVLAARAGRATLLLPRDRRVVRHAAPAAVLDALTGLTLSPGDLLAIISGCGVAHPRPVDARRYGRDWVRVDLVGGTQVYLRREQGAWRTLAVLGPALRVEYGPLNAGFPRTVRLTDRRGRIDLRLTLSQVDVNVPLDARTFRLRVPDDAAPMTLDELRRLGLLGGSGASNHAHASSP